MLLAPNPRLIPRVFLRHRDTLNDLHCHNAGAAAGAFGRTLVHGLQAPVAGLGRSGAVSGTCLPI